MFSLLLCRLHRPTSLCTSVSRLSTAFQPSLSINHHLQSVPAPQSSAIKTETEESREKKQRDDYRLRLNARRKAKYVSDPHYRELAHARWRNLSPAALERRRHASALDNRRRWTSDFVFKQRALLWSWLTRTLKLRDLQWRTHEAQLSANPVKRHCSGCGYVKPPRKLWFRRIVPASSDSNLFDCFRCFTSEWVPEKVLPIGYEHVVFGSRVRIKPRSVSTPGREGQSQENTRESGDSGTTAHNKT